MLRRIHDPDKGASFVEYAAVIALVGVIIASLLMSGIPRQISDGIAGAVDDALNAEGTVPEGGEPGAPGVGGSESLEGGSGFPGGNGADGVDGTPDSGAPGSAVADNAPYDPDEFSGGATPAVWNGGDDFTVQQSLSWGEFWDWGSGGKPAFTFEDRGDYNWYCGEILLSVCYLGGGIAQGAAEASEDAENTLCHVRFMCTKEETSEAWAETGQGAKNLVTDPVGSLGDMWDGLWATPRENRENLSEQGAFWKDSGYWIPQVAGAPFRALRILGDNGRSSDGNGNEQNRDGSDCSNSFVPGTLVVLADGTAKPIELIQVGDRVLASDPQAGEQGPREVTHLILGTGEKTLVDVTVDDGSGDTASVTATDNHPFWVPEQGWTEAIDLERGSWLQTSAGAWVQVSAVDAYSVQSERVYNFTVDDLHTYYVLVSDTAVLVHNCPDNINWNWRSGPTFGHTFDKHGKGSKNKQKLTDIARATQTPQGQWLDNQKAAELIKDNYVEGAGVRRIMIPEGLGQVIMPDGTVAPARWALIVPRNKKSGVYASVYPISDPPPGLMPE